MRLLRARSGGPRPCGKNFVFSESFTYNTASNVVQFTDCNGSKFSNTWDPMSRKTNKSIAPASGIGGTTAQSFQYNGLGQTTFARDTANGNNADSINRLLQYQRGTLNSTGGYQNNGGGGITAANALPGSNTQENWNLDGVGNSAFCLHQRGMRHHYPNYERPFRSNATGMAGSREL